MAEVIYEISNFSSAPGKYLRLGLNLQETRQSVPACPASAAWKEGLWVIPDLLLGVLRGATELGAEALSQ